MGSRREVFSGRRAERIRKIYFAITANWRKANRLTYIVRATEALDGFDLSEIRKRYFAVGVDANSLTEIPFVDMLVVMSMVGQYSRAVKQLARGGKSGRVGFSGETDWRSDEKVIGFLSGLRIETPFDADRYLTRIPGK